MSRFGALILPKALIGNSGDSIYFLAANDLSNYILSPDTVRIMNKREKYENRRKEAGNEELVTGYLANLLDIDNLGSKEMNISIMDLSPLSGDDIEHVIECFSDRFAIGYEKDERTSRLVADQKRRGASKYLRGALKFFEPDFPYAIDLSGISVAELVAIARRGYWPLCRKKDFDSR